MAKIRSYDNIILAESWNLSEVPVNTAFLCVCADCKNNSLEERIRNLCSRCFDIRGFVKGMEVCRIVLDAAKKEDLMINEMKKHEN